MSDSIGYLFAGLGGGAVIASLALGLVLEHRASGVLNFAHAAIGMYLAYAYFEFRATGDLVLPLIGLPSRFHLLARPTLASALVVVALLGAVLGIVVFWLVFRPLRHAPPLARLVASLGLLLYLQEVVRLQFPTAGASVVVRRPILPDGPVRFLGTTVTANRLLLAGLVVIVAVALTVTFRVTRFGLATRAAAANEKGALLAGIAPDRLGSACWAIASMLAGAAVIMIEPISGLDPGVTPLLVVPALAAALIGGLRSFGIAAAAGIGIGMVQSFVLGWAVRPSTTWIPDWLPTTGLGEAVPVIVIVIVLVVRGDVLPDRSAIIDRTLPSAPMPRHVLTWTAVLGGGAVLALLVLSATYRQALVVTMIFALLALSIVVVTGFTGQISLAQVAFAGVAGFTVIRLTDHGWPFVPATLAACLVATALGLLVAYPASRVRGMSLAVATLAMAVAIEGLVLASEPFSGGSGGSSAGRPSLFGLDLGFGATGSDNFRPAFGIVVVVVLALAAIGVANLRRNRTGLRWLALRANERAAAAAGIDVTRAKLGAFAVSSFLAGLSGVLTAYATTNLSPTSFVVIGALVALALTYLGGVSSISGAIVAGCLAQAGIVTTAMNQATDGGASRYVFAISGLALILTAVLAPQGLTGLWRQQVRRLRRHPGAGRAGLTEPAAVASRPVPAIVDAAGAPTKAVATERLVLDAYGLTVTHGGVVALDDVDVQVTAGQIVGLIGPNGAGKTTLIDTLSGFTRPDEGGTRFVGDEIGHLPAHERAGRGLVRTFQSLELFDDLTVRQNLVAAEGTPTFRSTVTDVFHPKSAVDAEVDAVLARLGLTEVADRLPSELSNGQRHDVALARALVARPRLLLLDEPAAGLDPAETAELRERLRDLPAWGTSVLLVDHDMALVLGVCDVIHVLDFGRVIASGPPAEIRQDPRVIAAYLGLQSVTA